MDYLDLIGTAAGAGLLGAMGTASIVLFIVVYVYSALALMAIAKKTKTANGWFAFVPILNILLMINIAQVPWWTIFVIFASIIPLIGGLLFLAAYIWWFWKICERVGKPGWWSILMLVPLVNLVILGVLAWSK